MKTAANADEFLFMADQFRLGELVTEQPHPLTRNLSELARHDLPQAVATLKEVDRLALEKLSACANGIQALAAAVGDTFAAGGNVFLCGCGATGRLSLALETLSREGILPPELAGRVTGFMAGGDAALIRSLEGFEDFPAYGERQLRELGFGEKDLLLAITEGGETPFVIGACEAAATISRRKPWFLYCNPDTTLARVAERSRRVLEHPGIHKLNLCVGPMALTGSTRMQASTVQMLAAGLALEHHAAPKEVPAALEDFNRLAMKTDWGFLAEFIAAESDHYTAGGHILYETDAYGITVLADTTERSPTFSLPAFENTRLPGQPASLCYLCLPHSPDSAAAWAHLLRRTPRCLEWEECRSVAGLETLLGFDISLKARTHRRSKNSDTFCILQSETGISLNLGPVSHQLALAEQPLLFRHLLLKLLLNTHSTLVMGRLGRYEGNLMTWVKPSNNKLIDRAVRFIRELYHRRTGQEADYAETARVLYRVRETLGPDEAIVLKTLDALSCS
ncbi:SIS domain-containing protein [Ruficoccus amylovorans]|uniref:SIS domain-containing protein n=1 Tax=Ruficoccus amylovorans TaxID=1804625 RepID=A0A842HE37_9BACT|nr:SIS domain-containing protein [Ruficoccus amylovorans]MBC2594783.1 SIS domain-containing protein [Ruficoccus amylovorans]